MCKNATAAVTAERPRPRVVAPPWDKCFGGDAESAQGSSAQPDAHGAGKRVRSGSGHAGGGSTPILKL